LQGKGFAQAVTAKSYTWEKKRPSRLGTLKDLQNAPQEAK